MNHTLNAVRALVERLNPHPTHVTVSMARHGVGLCEQARVCLVFSLRSPIAGVGEALLTLATAIEAEGLHVISIGQASDAISMDAEDASTSQWLFRPSFQVVMNRAMEDAI